ncbi:MAG: hypothetical protein LIO93_00715 [Bacteroidales bacterium]|nr:hypothetical protein [Bacteroidales bacterium]
MKKVSILSVLFLMIGFTTVFAVSELADHPAEPRPNYIKTKDFVEVAFTNEFTLDSLVFIKEDLKTIGITLSYKQLEFRIKAYIVFSDGNKGPFSVGDLNSVNKDKRFGFYRDYSEENPAWGTGNLDVLHKVSKEKIN